MATVGLASLFSPLTVAQAIGEPTVTGVSPHFGAAAGGSLTTPITVTGTLFTTASKVSFKPASGSAIDITTVCSGTPSAPCFTITDDSHISIPFVPASPDATAVVTDDVLVTNLLGTSSAAAPGDHYTWVPAPTITAVTGSATGPSTGNTALTLTGTNFTSSADGVTHPTTEVDVGGVAVTSTTCPNLQGGCFTLDSASQITLHTPPHAAGAVSIGVVTDGGSASFPSAFTYVATAPTVSAIQPSAGVLAPDSSFTAKITGSNLSFATKVTVGTNQINPCPDSGNPCFTVANNSTGTEIDISGGFPAAAQQETDAVVVTNAAGDSNATVKFTYAGQVTLTQLTPTFGALGGGDTLTLTGTNFEDVVNTTVVYTTSKVSFTHGATTTDVTATCGGLVTTNCFTVVSATQLTVKAPPGTAGTSAVTVTTVDDGGTNVDTSGSLDYVYSPDPAVVTSVTPVAGKAAGGNTLVIAGSNFSGSGFSAYQLERGGTPWITTLCGGAVTSNCFTVDNAGQITAKTPSGSAGFADVTVDTETDDLTWTVAGTANSPDDQYVYVTAPAVSSVTPTSGSTAGLTRVTVAGSGFKSSTGPSWTTTEVDFGTTQVVTTPCPTTVTAPCFTVDATNQVTVYSPPHAAQTVDITVVTPGGTSATSTSDHFTFIAPTPAVTGVAPNAGPTAGGTSVVISGSGFTAATKISFGTTDVTTTPCPVSPSSACFTIVDDSTIDAVSPSHSAGTVDVTVTTAGGSSATGSSDTFTFAAAPAVSTLNPTSEPTAGGIAVTITGTNFSGGNVAVSGVDFGSTAITTPCPNGVTADCFTVDSATQITAYPPAAPAGQVDVQVTTQGGTSAAAPADHFIFVQPNPTVTAVSPSNGPTAGGTTVTITGTDFSGDGFTVSTVSFGTGNDVTTTPCPATPTSACFTADSPTSITAFTPAGSAVGPVDVVVTTASTDATSTTSSATSAADQFTYGNIPSVTGVSPTAGPAAGGNAVSISGANLTFVTSVKFGSTSISACTSTHAGCFVSGSTITAYPPAGSGTVDIQVVAPDGSSQLTSADRYTFVPLPTVSNVSPNIGPSSGGTAVTVSGTNFSGSGWTTSEVDMGVDRYTTVCNGGTSDCFTVTSPTSITVHTRATSNPFHAQTTSSSLIDVRVITPGGTSASSSADQFTFLHAPTVDFVLPPVGLASGGLVIGVFGTGFTQATAVHFGSISAPFEVLDDNVLITLTPQTDPGTVDITVDSPGGRSALNEFDLFTFLPEQGYWLAGTDGGIFAFGSAGFFGSMGGQHLNAPIVGIAPTLTGQGYWMVASDGGIFAFGDAPFFGSMGGQHLNSPIVGIAPTVDGFGYWLVAADGGIFAFGDAPFWGSMGGQHLNKPIVSMAPTPDSGGYWMVASDGGIFAFGDAQFYGSMGGQHLNQPIVGMAPTWDGGGYWMVASDGGIFSFGDAEFLGSMGGTHLNQPIVGMSVTGDGGGYRLVASDGGIFSFGDAEFHGSMGGTPLNRPVVGIASLG